MEANILTGIEQEINLQPAPQGTRLANYIIDVIGYYLVILLVGFLLPHEAYVSDTLNGTMPSVMSNFLISFSVIIGYYTVLEGATKGRTLGKLVTRTVAVKQDGSAITWKDAFLRSLCRLVPFEPFSALGQMPWHDKWTKTIVVKNVN